MKEKITMNELFSGIGAQIEGINMTHLFDCEVKCTAEIEKDAMLSYAIMHCGLTQEYIKNQMARKDIPFYKLAKFLTDRNIGFNFKTNKPYDWYKLIKNKKDELMKYYLACKLSLNKGDISKIKQLPYADLWTYSFPCQDISVAGLQKGIKKGTRSGLLLQVERLLKISKDNNTLPKYLLLENVKNLVGQKHKKDFDIWINILNELGYNTYWKIINGRYNGIPQNRERVFAISIRKNIDTRTFCFVNPYDSRLGLENILENDVDKKYFCKKTKKSFIEHSIKGNTNKLVCEQRCDEGLRFFKGDYIGTLRTIDSCGDKRVIEYINGYPQIRKLTPKECWRFMGFKDEYIDKVIQFNIPQSKLYAQAGNSIITNCISNIIFSLYKAQYNKNFVIPRI